MAEMRTKLVGVTFKDEGEHGDRQLNIKQLQPNQKLFFHHEKDNPFDPNAMKVYADEQLTKPLGYLKKQLASDLNTQKNMGWHYSLEVEQITGDDSKSMGCNVKITATKEERAKYD